MKRYCLFAKYKDTQNFEGFDYYDKFSQAKAAILRIKNKPQNQCFDLWGIDVFDTTKDNYTHHYILINGIFELRAS